LGDSLQTTLTLASDSLDAVDDTLLLTQSTVDQAGSSIDTLSETATNVSTTMTDMQPLMDKVTQSATQQVPDSIEAIQTAIPDVAEAAGAIDDTLRILDSFEVDRQIFGIPIQFDLGINYQPAVPLNTTVLTLGQSLDGVPGDLRALRQDMTLASDNLATIGGNIETIAGDLDQISQTVDQIGPLLVQYVDIVAQTQELITQAQNDLDGQLAALQLAATALFVWLGLNQIVPLYLGWSLMREDEDDAEKPNSESIVSSEAVNPTFKASDTEESPVVEGDESEADEG
jgi:hypothetical protein